MSIEAAIEAEAQAQALHADRLQARLPGVRREAPARVRGQLSAMPDRSFLAWPFFESACALADEVGASPRARCPMWTRTPPMSTTPAVSWSGAWPRPACCVTRCRPPGAAASSAWTCARSALSARRWRASPLWPTSPSPCRGSAAARSPCSAPTIASAPICRRSRRPQDRGACALRARCRLRCGSHRDHRRAGWDGFVLNGAKTWISNAGIADFYVVLARTGEAPGARGLSAFIVDADTPGLAIGARIG